ncbi:hypothetical protein HDU98_006600 [Podochytrium sp. JEL0797]|nr:hypothetical protein HDU98_006600 [Podochytrium sp. JEL0797]
MMMHANVMAQVQSCCQILKSTSDSAADAYGSSEAPVARRRRGSSAAGIPAHAFFEAQSSSGSTLTRSRSGSRHSAPAGDAAAKFSVAVGGGGVAVAFAKATSASSASSTLPNSNTTTPSAHPSTLANSSSTSTTSNTNNPRRPRIPAGPAWRFKVTPHEAPGVLRCDTGTARFVLLEHRAEDLRKAVADDAAALRHANQLSNSALLPKHNADNDSLPNAQNAWAALTKAMSDAMEDIASLSYNKELAEAYQSDEPDDENNNEDENNEDDDDDDEITLSKGLILTKDELALLEYSANRKVEAFCGIVATLSTTAASLLVRVSYEPRAGNEVELAKGDVVSLWYAFDDTYGYGLNRNNGQVGYINLAHLDQRRLASSTQPPPLPAFSIPPQFAPASSSMHSGASSVKSGKLNSPAIASPPIPLPFPPTTNPPLSVVKEYQQTQIANLQAQLRDQQPPQRLRTPPSRPTPHTPFPAIPTPSSPYQSPRPVLFTSTPTTHTTTHTLSTLSTTNSNTSPITTTTTSTPHLRISDRLAARQMDAERYNHMESELDSLLSAVTDRGQSLPPPPRGSSYAAPSSAAVGGPPAMRARRESLGSVPPPFSVHSSSSVGGGSAGSEYGSTRGRVRRESLVQTHALDQYR